MSFKPGDRLASHPNGHRLVAYEADGALWSALYHPSGIVQAHPDSGWGVFNGGHWQHLTVRDINAMQELAPDADMPPLWPAQAGLVAVNGNGHADTNGSIFVDWEAFWKAEPEDDKWLYDRILAKGRGHAIFASHKVGKSLALLYISLQLATGDDPVVVVYLDYEMSRDDLEERLTDMGADRDTDLSRLRYALIPALPPLDTTAGAEDLLTIVDQEQAARPDHHLAVIVDTTARAVAGEENSADTIRAFYRHTGSALKRRGVTWARLDHAGKDGAKGQRGSSAKGDDVDIIWRVTPADRGLRLVREAARVSWAPEVVNLARHDDPLRFQLAAELWPAGVEAMVDLLNRLGAPINTTVRAAQELLKQHGEGYHSSVLNAAVRYRKQGLDITQLVTKETPGNAGNKFGNGSW